MDNDVELARVGKGQLSLFPLSARNVCRSMGLNWLTAIQLYKDGFLSFNPVTAKNMDSAQEAELKFLGSLIIAGCNKEMLQKLVRYLKKPYRYRHKSMYYDWVSQRWFLLPQVEEDEGEEDSFESWIESL